MRRLFQALLLFLIVTTAYGADSNDTVARIDRYLNRAVENGYSGSVLVAKGDKILLSKGYGFADSENEIPFTAETIFDIGSITKQFTAACILKLEDQGKLSTHDPIAKFFDSVPEDKKGITLHQLLTHTAGMTDSLGPDEEWISREDYLKEAFASKLFDQPGKKYAYSNVGYSILAAVVERVSGKDYEEFLLEQLLKPAGMKETGYRLPNWDKSRMAIGYQNGKRWGTTYDQSNYARGVTWHLKGNGGIHSTTADLYSWAQAMQGTKVLSESAKKKYFAPHVPSGDNEFYAYGWAILKKQGQTVIGHNGGNGSFMDTLEMIPEKEFVVVASTNRYPKNTDTIANRIQRMVFEDLPELAETFRKNYEGVYLLPSGVNFSVWFNENDEAVTELNDPESWRLLAGGDSENADRAKQIDQKTRAMLTGMLTGDVAKIVSATGLDEEEIKKEFVPYLQRMENQNGGCKTFDVLGPVERRRGEYHLTPVRFKCEKKDVLKLMIWHGDRLFEFRDLPDGNRKNFEHVQENEFFSDANQRSILFDEADHKPAMRIKTAKGEIIARKKT